MIFCTTSSTAFTCRALRRRYLHGAWPSGEAGNTKSCGRRALGACKQNPGGEQHRRICGPFSLSLSLSAKLACAR